MARFRRSDFCLPCHNLPASDAVQGRPLLNTWREWAASPLFLEGVQCQDCHMPAGGHGFKGAHDAEMVAKAVQIGFGPVSEVDGEVSTMVTVKNVGAGHYFPTTATPRAVLHVQLMGPSGPVVGTRETWPIGRTVSHVDGRWTEAEDTRIPPRSLRRWSYSATRGDAESIEATVFFYPDWIYIGFYQGRLARPELSKEGRAALKSALKSAESSVITAGHIRRDL